MVTLTSMLSVANNFVFLNGQISYVVAVYTYPNHKRFMHITIFCFFYSDKQSQMQHWSKKRDMPTIYRTSRLLKFNSHHMTMYLFYNLISWSAGGLFTDTYNRLMSMYYIVEHGIFFDLKFQTLLFFKLSNNHFYK